MGGFLILFIGLSLASENERVLVVYTAAACIVSSVPLFALITIINAVCETAFHARNAASVESSTPAPKLVSATSEALPMDFLYEVFQDGAVMGPFPLSEIADWRKEGGVDGETQVRKEGSSNWVPLSSVMGN